MKKLLFGLLATVLLSVSANAQSKANTEIGKTYLTPKKVGMYAASTGCSGWSFCIAGNQWDNPSQVGNTFQTLNADNTMTFKIPYTAMSADNVKFYENKTTFELKDNSQMQVGEYKLFGLKPSSRYIAGVYSLVNDGTAINFTIKFEQ